jgi:hypothetical protein
MLRWIDDQRFVIGETSFLTTAKWLGTTRAS